MGASTHGRPGIGLRPKVLVPTTKIASVLAKTCATAPASYVTCNGGPCGLEGTLAVLPGLGFGTSPKWIQRSGGGVHGTRDPHSGLATSGCRLRTRRSTPDRRAVDIESSLSIESNTASDLMGLVECRLASLCMHGCRLEGGGLWLTPESRDA